jgi:sugar phosphate isomerase/epimerase
LVGIMSSSLKGYEGRAPVDTMEAARSAGLDGVLFGNILELSPTLETAALKSIAGEAKARGMRLGAGLGSFNPSKPERNMALAAAGGGDIVAGLGRAIDATAALGTDTLFFVIGMIEDREDPALPWASQLARVTETLIGLRSRLLDSGVKLLLKTHEELTTFEAVRVIEAVGSDVMGISHDPVNLPCRIEDAVAATARVAPYVRQVHLDDATVTFDGSKLRRYLAPMGSGDIDWTNIFSQIGDVPVWIEFHRGQFAMPVFDRDWIAAQPDLTLDEYRAILAPAVVRFAKAETPWDQADPFGRLPAALAWLAARG